MIVFIGREMSGGNGHEHVSALLFVSTPSTAEQWTLIVDAVKFLDAGNKAYVEDQARPGTFVEAFVVRPANGHPYIRTAANGRWTDNILALPQRRRAA